MLSKSGVSYQALALALGVAVGKGALVAEAREPTVTTTPPEGFADLDQIYSTIYDVFYLGDYVGSYFGTLNGSVFSFENPDNVVSGFDDGVDKDKLKQLFSEILAANGRLACRRGEADECGTLPAGQSGVVVDANRFRIDVSLSREYLNSDIEPIRYLGDPVSKPSFIQNVSFAGSFSQNSESNDRVSFGLNSIASAGRNSLTVQSRYDNDTGGRIDEFRAQRIEDKWKGSAGLMQAQDSGVVRSYDFYGLEFTNNSGTVLRREGGEERTPLDIVLPRPATVEIYKDGYLVSARNYDAGLQQLNTEALPSGSYAVEIVARAGGETILRETRSFSRTSNLPGPDKTLWTVRAGLRAKEDFGLQELSGETGDRDDDLDLLPEATEELAAELRVSHRLTESLSFSGAVTYVNENLIPEAGVDWYAGVNRISVIGAAGTTGGYAITGSYSRPIGNGGVAVSYRSTRSGKDNVDFNSAIDGSDYDPFLRDEDQVNASIYAPLFGGSFSVLGSYSTSPDIPDDRYRVGARYSKRLDLLQNANTTLSFDATTSDQEDRVGVRLTFSQRTSEASRISGSIGAESRRQTQGAWETDPTAQVDYTRTGRSGSVDYVGTAGLSTNSFEHRAYVGANVVGDLGAIDAAYVVAQQEQSDDLSTQLTFGGHTGFAVTTEAFHLGMREPGDALIIARVKKPEPPAAELAEAAENSGGTLEDYLFEEDDHRRSRGGYRMVLNNQRQGYLKGRSTSAVGVSSLQQYSVALEPVDAPEYDIDLTPQTVPLFPGNVAVIDFEATEVATLFGRIVSDDDQALAFARLESGKDQTITDQRGYFTLTSARNDPIKVYTSTGQTCELPVTGLLVDFSQPDVFHRVGDVKCK
ncbi:MAG: TcfC E-set like domain-containing protein [Pseudomonadota bacterium]|nr:TcfC E-set like domain-containing protein [Pseudomonadota bacterium]